MTEQFMNYLQIIERRTIFFENKADAVKAQKVFVQLAKLCGATLIN